MAVLDDLGAYLAAQVGSLTLGTNLYLARLPDDPDTCVAVYEYVGGAPLSTMNGAALPLVERPRVQVVTRASSYTTGRSLADEIWTALEQIVNDTTLASGDRYHRVAGLQSPFALERDSHDRIIIAQNFEVSKAT
jgi:hypothetical protein